METEKVVISVRPDRREGGPWLVMVFVLPNQALGIVSRDTLSDKLAVKKTKQQGDLNDSSLVRRQHGKSQHSARFLGNHDHDPLPNRHCPTRGQVCLGRTRR